MGRHQRAKGRRGELEVLARLTALGADGELLYGQAELGGKDGDLDTTLGRFEVKRRAAFPAWMTLQDSVRGVYLRRDRGEWMILLRAKDAELLMQIARWHFEQKDSQPASAGAQGGTDGPAHNNA